VIELADPEQRTAPSAATVASPLDAVAVRWSPVIGRDARPIGFRLALDGTARDAPLAPLLDAVLAGFAGETCGMPHGLVLLAPAARAADASLGHWGGPRNVLLELDACVLDDEAGREHVARAQRHGVRLALRVGGPGWPAADRLAPFQYLVSPAAAAAAAGRPPRDVALLASDAASRAALDAALAAGATGVIGWPVDPPPRTETLRPQQRALLNLIRLVQGDADTADIERELKRDPILAYMLLTLANSPAFMRTAPIASLSHAIQLLGYQRLVKWLVLLLVIASKDGKALAAIYGAVLRGLLLENCAAAAGALATVRDQCFVVGAFSLLDRITGRSLAQLTQEVPLPDPVVAALNGCGGPYAAWLELARAVEDDGAGAPLSRLAAAAGPLGLTPGAVNLALLKALATNDALQTMV
jgi:EAL and modified HD-GYP domain-containing signal transduction protein